MVESRKPVRTVTIVVALLSVLGLAAPDAMALSEPNNAVAATFSKQAKVVDEQGREYPVEVVQRVHKVDTTKGVLHYEVSTLSVVKSLPGATAKPAIGPMNSAGGCEYDGSFVFLMCLTQFYDERFSEFRYISVRRYVASWYRNDPQFAMSRGEIRAAVSGPCLPGSGCGYLFDNQARDIDSPVNGTAYTLYPRWAGKYVLVEGAAHYQCGTSTITARRGSSTYTFSHSSVCQGTP
jgi:hypothetical protein